jgi:hypothetical protein
MKGDKNMIFERRDFFRIGTAGMAAGLMTPVLAMSQDSSTPVTGELEGGTGSLRLEGRLKAGLLKLEARDFTEGHDRSVVVHSSLNSIDMYSGMFSYEYDATVFAVLRDNGHTTSIVLSNTDDSSVGRIMVCNDSEPPGIFGIDKGKFIEKENLKESILDGKGASLDVVGKRKPPLFVWRELESVFGNEPALLEFMRGKKARHQPSKDEYKREWICRVLSWVPGSTLALAWRP